MWKHPGIVIVIVALASAAVPLAVAVAAGESAKERAVREVVARYLAGHATGDGKHWAAAFHPDSKLFWVKDGQLAQRSSADFVAGAAGKPAADEASRKRRILSIDVAHDAAVAKVELDYPGRHLVDYLSLLEVDGRWRIVNKIFTTLPR